jgi:hypothetical protein
LCIIQNKTSMGTVYITKYTRQVLVEKLRQIIAKSSLQRQLLFNKTVVGLSFKNKTIVEISNSNFYFVE